MRTELLLIFFLLARPIAASAQRVQDAAVLLGFGLEKKIGKSFDISFSHQTQIAENASEVRYSFFDLGLTGHLTRNWSLGAHYRFSAVRNLDNFFSERHLYYLEAQYAKGLGPRLSFSARGRWQAQLAGTMPWESYRPVRQTARLRAGLRLRHYYFVQPYCSLEGFYRLDRSEISNLRTVAGVLLRWNDRFQWNLFYQSDCQLNQSRNRTVHNFGASFNIRL
jgi:hypothetical protein